MVTVAGHSEPPRAARATPLSRRAAGCRAAARPRRAEPEARVARLAPPAPLALPVVQAGVPVQRGRVPVAAALALAAQAVAALAAAALVVAALVVEPAAQVVAVAGSDAFRHAAVAYLTSTPPGYTGGVPLWAPCCAPAPTLRRIREPIGEGARYADLSLRCPVRRFAWGLCPCHGRRWKPIDEPVGADALADHAALACGEQFPGRPRQFARPERVRRWGQRPGRYRHPGQCGRGPTGRSVTVRQHDAARARCHNSALRWRQAVAIPRLRVSDPQHLPQRAGKGAAVPHSQPGLSADASTSAKLYTHYAAH